MLEIQLWMSRGSAAFWQLLLTGDYTHDLGLLGLGLGGNDGRTGAEKRQVVAELR
jgi:hypothetical protein